MEGGEVRTNLLDYPLRPCNPKLDSSVCLSVHEPTRAFLNTPWGVGGGGPASFGPTKVQTAAGGSPIEPF